MQTITSTTESGLLGSGNFFSSTTKLIGYSLFHLAVLVKASIKEFKHAKKNYYR